MELVGKNLGQYRIIEPIGAGGMASVYKAYQPGLDRNVAIKVLPAQHALTPGFKERFSREAKAVAQLSHPNILPIYDVGIDNDISYFVMKYVPGRTLKDVMGRPIPLKKICDYIDQIAGALDHAHQSGILHRDIKPVNILMEDDWLLLADFGLAKIVEGTEALTATGSSMGTPAYVSPEQATGKPVDHHTDIYSLGIILYEMVTGKVPYSGETPMGVMFKHVYEPLPMPRQIKPDMPEAVERVILKALAKEPEHRFNSAGDLAQALRGAVETGHTESETVLSAKPLVADDAEHTIPHTAGVTASAEMDRSERKPPLWVWAVGAVVLLLIIIGGAFFIFSGSDAQQSGRRQQELIIAQAESGETPTGIVAEATVVDSNIVAAEEPAAEEPAAEQPAAEEEVAEEAELAAAEEPGAEESAAAVEAESSDAPVEESTATPQPAASPTEPAGGRSFADVPQLSASVLLGRGPINTMEISPDGETLAVAGSRGVWLYDAPSLTTLQLFESEGPGVAAAGWSPDGSQIAAANDDGSVHIWDVAGQTIVQTLVGHTDAATSVAWSLDGSKVAAGSYDGRIKVWTVDDGQEITTLTGHLYEPYSLAWSPDSAQLVSVSGDATVRVWDIAGGGELQRLENHLDEVSSVDFSPDGSRIVTGSDDLTIRIWNTSDWQEEVILSGHTEPVLNAVWSPNGAQIASGSFDGTIRIWDAATGETLQTLEGHAHPGVAVVWLPDGNQLVSAGLDGTLRLWDITGGAETARINEHTSLLRDVAWSPDGTQLAAVGFGGHIYLWDVESESGQILPAPGEFMLTVTWSPDGTQLATGNTAGEVKVWDAAGGDAIHTLTGHADQITAVAWSPDGSQIASASWDGTARLWDPGSGAKLREMAGHADIVNSIAWSPDGKQLASGSDDFTVVVWDAASGETVRVLETSAASDNYKYDYRARGSSWIKSVDWSPDGKRLAAGSSDFVIRIWDATSGAQLRMLEGPEVLVLGVDWASDSTRLAATGVEGRSNIVVWNAAKDEPLYKLFDHTDTVYGLDWSPDGTRLASTGNDGVVRVWKIPAE